MKSLLKFQHNKLCISAGFVEGAGGGGGVGGGGWLRRHPFSWSFLTKNKQQEKKNREVPLDFNSVPVAFVLIKL